MDKLDLVITIGIVSVIIIGGIIYFFAGLFKPKKNHAIIIEKMGEYHITLTKGAHFYNPMFYKCVGYYCLLPQVRKVKFSEELTLEMTFQIIDPKLYHYSTYKADEYLIKVRKENSELTLAILKDEFKKIGIDFINIRKPLK